MFSNGFSTASLSSADIGMSNFLGNSWIVLVDAYQAVYSAGYVGCFVALVMGLILTNRGARITGCDESFTDTVNNGIANIRRNPTIEGTAELWVGRLFGSLLQLAGTILIVSILIFVNIVMYGEPRR